MEIQEVSDFLGEPAESIRQVTGHPKYFITKLGKVVSSKGQRLRRLRLTAVNGGHLYVDLYRDGEPRRRYVHHLVLEEFIGPRPSSIHVGRHKDDVQHNNHLDNLEWALPEVNHRDRAGKANSATKLSDEQKCLIWELARETGGVKEEGARPGGILTYEATSRLFGVSMRYAADIAKGRSCAKVERFKPDEVVVAKLPPYSPKLY